MATNDLPPSALAPSWVKLGIAALTLLVLYAPFAAKPVHIDDANFLMLAEGAARDPWRPHSIQINWSGVTEPAYAILANPPGIAWYLMPVRNAPEWVQHLWMLPWLALGAWGCARLVREYVPGREFAGCLFLLTCPVIVIAAHALTPDLPLFACATAGIGGFVTSAPARRGKFALLAGCAALFRYSGGTVIPLLVLIGWRRSRWRGAVVALMSAVPLAALAGHDLHAYGQVHFLATFFAQNDLDKKSIADVLGNPVAGIAMLGGAGVLPILVWRREAVAAACLGAGLGVNAAWFSGQSTTGAVATVLSTAAGGAALSLAMAPRVRNPELSAWAIGGALFFFTVRFAATRYWAAFVPAVGLLALRNAAHSRRWIAFGITANVAASFLLAVDDQNHALALKNSARRVAQMGVGNFSGHWGWQHYLEAAGWTPLERGGDPASIHARSSAATQQPPREDACLKLVERFTAEDRWWGPRLHAPYAQASYHAGGNRRYAPWTFSNEPYNITAIYWRCRTDSTRSADGGASP